MPFATLRLGLAEKKIQFPGGRIRIHLLVPNLRFAHGKPRGQHRLFPRGELLYGVLNFEKRAHSAFVVTVPFALIFASKSSRWEVSPVPQPPPVAGA